MVEFSNTEKMGCWGIGNSGLLVLPAQVRPGSMPEAAQVRSTSFSTIKSSSEAATPGEEGSQALGESAMLTTDWKFDLSCSQRG